MNESCHTCAGGLERDIKITRRSLEILSEAGKCVSVLSQCVAGCCSTLHCVAVVSLKILPEAGECVSVLSQCVAVRCSTLQYVAVCCSHFNRDTVGGRYVLQCCVAVLRCSVLCINETYGVATISRLLNIIGLFCKRAL